MNTPYFIKRLIGSVSPSERNRASRSTKRAIELCHALMSERGEVSGAVLAREALAAYDTLSGSATDAFFAALATEFAADPRQILEAADRYRDAPIQEHLLELQRVVEAPRQELFRRLNMAPGGTSTLVTLRHRLLDAIKQHPEWLIVDADLVHLFNSWFNRGFLTLERIDWNTPAFVLEQLIQYEAVHEIGSWRDLRRRLEVDRRCFAYFHPALPCQPIIFIEVALTKGLSDSVQPLLDAAAPVSEPADADSAIFYSITSCQEGLRGIRFGRLLIKQVVDELGREFPGLESFATLSPVSGFREWLGTTAGALQATPEGQAAREILKRIDSPDWIKGKDIERLQNLLTAFCAHYILHVKQGKEPADAVARFHLSNGAELERINWCADLSPRGLQRAAGLMVNYVYRPGNVEANHESYVKEQRIAASRQIRRLARECPLNSAPPAAVQRAAHR